MRPALRVLVSIAVAAGTLAACAIPAGGEAIRRRGDARPDVEEAGDPSIDSRARDVVVRIVGSAAIDTEHHVSACSGALLTPRLVITASHCLRGALDANGSTSFRDDTPYVFLGESSVARAWLRGTSAVAFVDRQVSFAERREIATDVAIVRLPASLDFADGVRIGGRPSFASPSTGAAHVAGFSPESAGGRRLIASADFERVDIDDARYFAVEGGVTRPGDSGGALFLARADGSRDLIGVTSAASSDDTRATSYMADITAPAMSAWIARQAQDTSRSDAWLARHGRVRGDYWLGELDTTGACDVRVDRDCDHWLDGHDDCPAIADVEQRDTDDDGRGDACDRDAPP